MYIKKKMSKKRKLNDSIKDNKLTKYLNENNFTEIDKMLSYDLKNIILTRVLKIKKLQLKVHRIWLDNNNLIECSDCGRIWDGNAQCDCFLYK